MIESTPMRIFVGGDATQTIAANVLEHSIRKHASGPVDVTMLKDLDVALPLHHRHRSHAALQRFRIPELCGHRGRALYLDAAMQVFRDIAELWRLPFLEQKILCSFQGELIAASADRSLFHPGRRFSVMLLDCDRLPWRADEVRRGLDEGRYSYEALLFEMCLVGRAEIGERIPVEWNHHDHHQPGCTALTHYAVVGTQPWQNNDHPLNAVWMAGYEAAVAAGAVHPQDVREGIRQGFLKPGLEPALSRAPAAAHGDERQRLERAAADIRRLQRDITMLRRSWTWRVGRLFTWPLRWFEKTR